MPRQARLDAPGTLHRLPIRKIERKSIFRDNRDRKEFVARLWNLTKETGTRVLAWSLLRNHVHRGVYLRYRQSYSENGARA
jgi:REP-associated tyrosine transposase